MCVVISSNTLGLEYSARSAEPCQWCGGSVTRQLKVVYCTWYQFASPPEVCSKLRVRRYASTATNCTCPALPVSFCYRKTRENLRNTSAKHTQHKVPVVAMRVQHIPAQPLVGALVGRLVAHCQWHSLHWHTTQAGTTSDYASGAETT